MLCSTCTDLQAHLSFGWAHMQSLAVPRLLSLRKHAYSNIINIPPPKMKTSAQNIDCVYSLEPLRRGGSNEYHNLCFRAEIRKIMYTPIKPSFTI